ncbi:hypothetical protein COCVIDRAFT_43132 [Bipolaris victoriae FI3]|uniref:Xylanolytic transcriptional activator regulatory domain-containing protein n=1 Tax=Bipolaris victoriae (strain FI3) TaxID=930091 RepID=W7E426_BIPV3|nr:hypothetical protein COCVIDRAFT_43132 [Bipolaris victoriae FI3]
MPSEACTPCRERKLRQKRTINRHKRARIDNGCGSTINREQLSQHPNIITDDNTSCQRLDGNGRLDSLAEAASTNAQMEGQQPSLPAMGFGITDLISNSHLPGSSWGKVLEYHNSLDALGILGEVLAGRDSRNLIAIDRGASHVRRDDELCGLDEHDISYLHKKGVFDLPPREICITPYTSKELIARAGFTDHADAQKTFYRRAVLLYDLNCEKDQLVVLQGSLLLGTSWRSYFIGKDFSFWRCNAARIAVKMGLNKRRIADDLGAKFYALLKRIWWTLYIRDILTSISGLDNIRHLRAGDFDTLPLTKDDWPEDEATCPQGLISILFPGIWLTVRFCRAAQRIWTRAKFLSLLMISLKCMIYRSASKNYPLGDIERNRMADSLHRAIFELDAIVRRAVTYRVGQFLPTSFSTAVATLVALCTELLIKPDIEPTDQLMIEEALRTGIAFPIVSQDTRPSL